MKRIILPLALCVTFCSAGANAATVESVVVSDFDNSVLTVSGAVDETEKEVGLVVLKKGRELLPGLLYSTDSSIQNATVSDGKFEAIFKFEAEEGTYEVYVSNSSQAFEFEYVSKEDALKFIEDLGNGKIAKSEIFEKLERYGTSIGIDVSFATTQSEKDYVTNTISDDYISKIKTDGIEAVREAISLSKAELEFMSKLKKASAASTVNTLLGAYESSAKIDLTDFNKLTSIQKSQICLKFVEASYTDMDTFKSDLKKAIAAVKSSSSTTTTTSGGSGGGGGGGTSSKNLPATDVYSATVTLPTSTEEQTQPKLLESFSDLGDTSWAWEPILFVVENNIMSGLGNGKFEPDASLTREQLAKILTLAFSVYDETLISDFADVDKDDWASSYVASAKESGLMIGTDEKNFGYGLPVSRQDICVAIYRAAKNSGIEFENNKTDFNDFKQINDYAKEAVSAMAGAGIINGMGDGNFEPNQFATRAQTATIISKILGEGDK